MKKKYLAILLLMSAVIAASYMQNMEKNAGLDSDNVADETGVCVPDPEYFIDCSVHDEKKSNTTLKVHNRTIFVENASSRDHLEIWEEILNDLPPHTTEYIIKIKFNENISDTSLMEVNYRTYTKIFCSPIWPYSDCLLDEIRVSKNIWTVHKLSRTYYKHTIAHEVGHSIRLNFSDREAFGFFFNMNETSDIFVTKYAMTSNKTNVRFSENEDFAEGIRFWRGNTVLFWKISERNEIMRSKFEIIARQICFSRNDNTTTCPVYVSRNATEDPPQNYNGTANNYQGLFEKDLKRKDILINKYIRDLDFEDLNSAMSGIENIMEY